MIDIINTLDAAFFPSVMKEYEVAMQAGMQEKPDKTIKLDPEMFAVLNKFTDMFYSQSQLKVNPKFHLPAKKRKRPEFRQLPEMQTKT